MVYIGFTQHVYICKLVHMQSHPIIVMYVQTLDGIANELVDHNARFRPWVWNLGQSLYDAIQHNYIANAGM